MQDPRLIKGEQANQRSHGTVNFDIFKKGEAKRKDRIWQAWRSYGEGLRVFLKCSKKPPPQPTAAMQNACLHLLFKYVSQVKEQSSDGL